MKTDLDLRPQTSDLLLSAALRPFSVVDRLVQFTSGNGETRQIPLADLTDLGFLEISASGNLLARSFVAPNGMLLVADLKQFPGTAESAFERLWHAHFRRNFKLVGMESTQRTQLHEVAESVFQKCRHLLPAAGRKFQEGYLETTTEGFRRILPRGENPILPELVLTGVDEEAINRASEHVQMLCETQSVLWHEGLTHLVREETPDGNKYTLFRRAMAVMVLLSPIRLTM